MPSRISIIIMYIFSFLVSGCTAFGKDPDWSSVESSKLSVNYDSQRQQFVNRKPDVLEKMRENTGMSAMFQFFFGGGKNRVPKVKLPSEKPDVKEFVKKEEGIKFIWFGHSSFLVNIQGKLILFDPVFSGSASPFSFAVKRFQEAALPLEEFPELDYIVISHDHYDHLDMDTVRFFQKKKTAFITPLGVGSHLRYWGVEKERITELDWWSSYSDAGLDFICTPAQHFSGRKGINGNRTLWGSWIVKSGKENFYFSGDSGYDVHFKNIGDKYGPFDLTFIENGQYNEMWRAVHVLPEETAQAFLDLKGKKLVPVHWGMFDLSLHDWYEPAEKLEEQAKLKNITLLTPKFGEIVRVKEDKFYERWWKNFMK